MVKLYGTRGTAQAVTIAFVTLVITSRQVSFNETATLLDAARSLEQRAMEPRLTAFPYGTRPTQDRSASNDAPKYDLRIVAAAASLLARGVEDPHSRAVAHLFAGNRDSALRILEQLTRREPQNATWWNDLAAARYEAGVANHDPAMFGLSLAAADRALRIDRSHLPASFNRALALEKIGLRDAAVAQFTRYAESDRLTPWSREVRDRIAHLAFVTETVEWNHAKPRMEALGNVETTVERFPQQTRVYAEGDYLARWAEAFVSGHSEEAARWLLVARRVGRALSSQRGEQLLDETVAAVDKSHQKTLIARAQLLYRQARISYSTEQRRVLEAVPMFEEAARMFASGGSPMALVARYYLANALFDAHRHREAQDLTDALREETPDRYAALQAQIYWLDATLAANNGEPYRALQSSEEAWRRFKQLGERENAARMMLVVATTLRSLGRLADSRNAHHDVFDAASLLGKASLRVTALNTAARDEILNGRWDIAASFFALETEIAPKSPRLDFDARLWGEVADARSRNAPVELDGARAVMDRVRDAALREDMQDELRFVEATNLVPPYRAVQLLSDTIDFRTRRARYADLSRAYLERGRIHRLFGDLQSAEKDLRSALFIVEKRRSTIERDDLRDAFFGTEARVPHELCDLLIVQNRLRDAFEVADRARALSQERAPDPSANGYPLHLDEVIQRDSFARDTIVHFTTLPSGTLITVIGSAGTRHVLVHMAEDGVRQNAANLISAIGAENGREAASVGRKLYDVLLAPVRDLIDDKSRLIIVPDDATASIPFAALRDSRNRYLLQTTSIVIAPSARSVLMSRGAARLPGNDYDLVIVADPAFAGTTFPRLSRLPGARQEIGTLARIFPRTFTLSGTHATTTNVLRTLARTRIAHIAAHAVPNQLDAWQSLIALAPGEKDDGALYLHRIAQYDLRNLDLVVLAGCRTGVMAGGYGDVRSLANAFLAAGARNAVASLWDLNDKAAAMMAERLFVEVRNGAEFGSALRSAQLRLLLSDDPALNSPKAWAALQIFISGE